MTARARGKAKRCRHREEFTPGAAYTDGRVAAWCYVCGAIKDPLCFGGRWRSPDNARAARRRKGARR